MVIRFPKTLMKPEKAGRRRKIKVDLFDHAAAAQDIIKVYELLNELLTGLAKAGIYEKRTGKILQRCWDLIIDAMFEENKLAREQRKVVIFKNAQVDKRQMKRHD